VIEDGSGIHDYAHESDCRWQIRVADGRRIRLEFTDFQTAKNQDFLHVFHGESTRQSDLIAMLSGDRPPPSMVSPSNQVLLWFPTSRQGVGKGFALRYRAVPDSVPMGIEQPWSIDTAVSIPSR
jgi:hypothetical protein